MKRLKPAMIVAALAVSISGAAPAFAQPGDRNPNSPGLGWGPRGAPGPLAAVGLPFLIAMGAVGAYKLVRRRKAGAVEDANRSSVQRD